MVFECSRQMILIVCVFVCLWCVCVCVGGGVLVLKRVVRTWYAKQDMERLAAMKECLGEIHSDLCLYLQLDTNRRLAQFNDDLYSNTRWDAAWRDDVGDAEKQFQAYQPQAQAQANHKPPPQWRPRYNWEVHADQVALRCDAYGTPLDVIGKGRSGTVFKGKLFDKEVAAKHILLPTAESHEAFLAEVSEALLVGHY